MKKISGFVILAIMHNTYPESFTRNMHFYVDNRANSFNVFTVMEV